jgi:hypothetical protein
MAVGGVGKQTASDIRRRPIGSHALSFIDELPLAEPQLLLDRRPFLSSVGPTTTEDALTHTSWTINELAYLQP